MRLFAKPSEALTENMKKVSLYVSHDEICNTAFIEGKWSVMQHFTSLVTKHSMGYVSIIVTANRNRATFIRSSL